ncbi:ATP-dependent Zn protease [Desulfosporosinus orientis DSM 765]|uniref:ATP-dependent Zn protease n=1 Tax=Desulfosporosinus orientis (strain ATCC 19365 / DSM 765 / NCIMB 8382 / VKM B-1628 / Singapore I) TaxID=768706 RepID=G7WGW0_DESOD|nr:AAA family ATPase [Desulfosporosinus orientis]AET68974.1 ATP-dependent Zn protease [Desulfosporosinus orientis DSM 765]
MKYDILIGVSIGVFAFLMVLGYNVLPIGLLIVTGFLVWKFVISRQLVKNGNGIAISTTGVDFEDIGGQNVAKKELQEALDFLLYSDRMKVLGIRPLKGILLSGPTGTGKTLLAKAAARYTNSTFLSVSGSEFVEMYAGVGAERVRSLFRRARDMVRKEKKTSAIIFIDEMDILGAKRGSNVSHHEYDQTLNQLLIEMDGLKMDQGAHILVMAATNRPEALDDALLRPGRFDRQVKVDLPDKEGRLAILKIHTTNKPIAQGTRLEEIAHETFGFSGAHLESVTNEAAILALREEANEITERHLREAVEKVMLGEKLDRKPTEEEIRRIAIHESGHAILAESVRPNSVSQVSIRSRGNALGYVRHYPKDDQYLYTQAMLEEQIMVALAGALAEEQLLGARSTGAAGDYEQALNLVEKILQSGMSPLGVTDISRLNADQRQSVTKDILAELEERTMKIIEENKESLLKITEILTTEETLNGDILRTYLKSIA